MGKDDTIKTYLEKASHVKTRDAKPDTPPPEIVRQDQTPRIISTDLTTQQSNNSNKVKK